MSLDAAAWGVAAHAAGALYVVAAEPISLGMYNPPSEYGADIVVAEGQSLGLPLSFGGPYVGLFACRDAYIRQMPGRIVGRTADLEGRTGYVLTLQTREQTSAANARPATSATSQQLIALSASMYLAALGPRGLRRVAELCYGKAHYAADRIDALPGFRVERDEQFFHEFVVPTPKAAVRDQPRAHRPQHHRRSRRLRRDPQPHAPLRHRNSTPRRDRLALVEALVDA